MRKVSNIDFFLKIVPLKDDKLVMSEMYNKVWGHRLRFGENMSRRTPTAVNLSISGLVSEEGHSGCVSQNIAIRTLKGNVLCQIWFEWTY